MRRQLMVALGLLVVLPAATCEEESRQATLDRAKQWATESKVAHMVDLGVIDGCRVKYVVMTVTPNFYLARCGDKQTETFYDSGGKHPTRIGVMAQE